MTNRVSFAAKALSPLWALSLLAILGAVQAATGAPDGSEATTTPAAAPGTRAERTAATPVSGPLAQAQQGPGGQSPSQPDGGRRRGPPPEAIAACQGKASGAACSFVNRRNETRTGTCFAPPTPPNAQGSNEHPLACRPQRPEHGEGDKAPS
jgi:hypothetical protein